MIFRIAAGAFLCIIGILLSTSCQNRENKEIFTIPEGKVGMIGFGSLTSKQQMQAQLEKSYDGPFEVVHLDGYQRYWNFRAPNDSIHPPFNSIMKCVTGIDTIVPSNCIFLNIQETDNASMNCCLFVIDEADLKIMDNTEVGYKRIDVAQSIREFEIVGGPVYAYQAKPEFTKESNVNDPSIHAIPSAYIDYLNAAFEDLGEEYEKEFWQSTEDLDERILLDCAFYEME